MTLATAPQWLVTMFNEYLDKLPVDIRSNAQATENAFNLFCAIRGFSY